MPRKADAADAAATDATVVTSAAVQSAEADSMPTMETLTDAADAAVTDANVPTPPAADGSVELTPLAVAQMELAQLEASLASLAATNPAYATLQALRDAAIGTVALAEAEAALEAEKNAQIAAVQALPNTPPAVVAAMVAAIESHYAPVPEAVPEAVLPIVAAPVSGRRPIGNVATERNATVAAALTVDTVLAARTDAAIAAWRGSADDIACIPHKIAGTRYAGCIPLGSAGSGVLNRADYAILTTAVRLRLELPPYSLPRGGQTVPVTPWLAAIGIYAAGGQKDNLPQMFTDRREIALYGDGRFRLALPNTVGVRFIRTDAAAYAQFNGGTVAAALPTPPATPTATVATPKVPTPPASAATPNGQIASTARCQHCSARNFTTSDVCQACGSDSWQIVGGVKIA